jgi:hypothetical protein
MASELKKARREPRELVQLVGDSSLNAVRMGNACVVSLALGF